MMITRKAFAVFTICTLSALTIPDVLSSRQVEAQTQTKTFNTDCPKSVTGTYLITISQNGSVASRSLITLDGVGNFFAVDSNQSGVPGVFNAFSDAQGAWKCTGNREITATTLNFSYQGDEGPASIGRSNYRVTFNPKSRAVQGTITLRFFAINANPLEDNAPVAGTFTFTGQRVTAN